MTIALSRLGGDVLFGGYRSLAQVPHLTRCLSRAAIVLAGFHRYAAGLAFVGCSKAQLQKVRDLLTTAPTVRHRYFRRHRIFSNLESAAFGLSAEVLGLDADFFAPDCALDATLDDLEPLAAFSRPESRYYMGNMILRDAGVFGIAHGREIRVPLVERAFLTPCSHCRGRGGPCVAHKVGPCLQMPCTVY